MSVWRPGHLLRVAESAAAYKVVRLTRLSDLQGCQTYKVVSHTALKFLKGELGGEYQHQNFKSLLIYFLGIERQKCSDLNYFIFILKFKNNYSIKNKKKAAKHKTL